MNPPKPHFLLFCEGNQLPHEPAAAQKERVSKGLSPKNSRWRFVLENVTSGEKFEANDFEAGCTPDRASLVAVLRGLEALEQPSKVTLVTNNRYVFRGLRYGLAEWRENDFAWEHFGAVQPIRNADIWRRIDRTLSYHEVQCRWMAPADASKTNQADSGEIKFAAGTVPPLSVSVTGKVPNATVETSAVASEHNVLVSAGVLVSSGGHSSSISASTTRVFKDIEAPDNASPPPAISRTEAGQLEAGQLERSLDASFEKIESAVTQEQMTRLHRSHDAAGVFSNGSGTSIQVHSPGASEPDPCISTRTTVTIANLDQADCENRATGESLAKGKGLRAETSRGHSPRSVLFYPFAICWTICKWTLLAVWGAILRLDEGVESYLRCMLLLDPKHYRRRK